MKNSIEHLIEAFNNGWTQGNFEAVEALLHESVIFVAPDLSTEIVGKDACLATIRSYTEQADTLRFEVEKQKIRVWQYTASVTIDYCIEYLMQGKNHQEKGKEFWTLSKENNHWKIVWRVMVSNQS